MEILAGLIVLMAGLILLILVYVFFGGVFTPKDDKLFSKIWLSEKSDASDAQDKAIQALLEKYYIIPDRGNLRFGLSHDGIDDVDRVGYNIGRLMGKAAEFDLKHQQSRGVLVSKILAKDLEFRLRVAGMSDFGEQLKMIQSLNVVQVAQIMENRFFFSIK